MTKQAVKSQVEISSPIGETLSIEGVQARIEQLNAEIAENGTKMRTLEDKIGSVSGREPSYYEGLNTEYQAVKEHRADLLRFKEAAEQNLVEARLQSQLSEFREYVQRYSQRRAVWQAKRSEVEQQRQRLGELELEEKRLQPDFDGLGSFRSNLERIGVSPDEIAAILAEVGLA
jgi:chromosome segregation ATPase